MSQLQSTELLAALAVATKPVKVVSLTGAIRFETPARALSLAYSRLYVGRQRNGRVVSLKELRETPPVRDDGYRTGLPIIQPSIEWTRAMGYTEEARIFRSGRMTEVVTACDIPAR